MAALQSALRFLAPVTYTDIPEAPEELDEYLGDLFAQIQTVVDSIPIADPDVPDTRKRSYTTSSIASNASEMSVSSARSVPPSPQNLALQKEWGKSLRLNKNENQLGISVYKVGGKDGRGAWFARRSVHEGLGFARFKKAFEKEFSTSLAVQGAPGEGNIRGIGAESKVEDKQVPHRGKIEVYRLSAQFPGPTTPRDFVTLLVTSSRAMRVEGETGKVPELAPRHYMIISKPCNHPDAQPRDGFIRGQYESVEFIREIPRKLKTSHSSTNLSEMGHKHGQTLEQDLLIRNAEKIPHRSHEDVERHHLRVNTSGPNSREPSPHGRKRSHTVNVAETPSRSHDGPDDYDPEENPVEWIMVTRSDPGGSVPRFLVERGTPASICADAVKFLDWACSLQESESPETPMQQPKPFRRESFTSWQDQESEPNLKGIQEEDNEKPAPTNPDVQIQSPTSPEYQTPHTPTGILSSVAGVLSAYAPQTVLNHLPYNTAAEGTTPSSDALTTSTTKPISDDNNDDAASTISLTSFASADSHFDSLNNSLTSPSLHDSQSLTTKDTNTQLQTQHEKDLAKLTAQRAALDDKFATTRAKLEAQASSASEKEVLAAKKAQEKHDREVKKHEERYARDLKKLEERKVKEAKKTEERKKKQEDKDEKARLVRERDEAVKKLEVMERERELWMKQVGELQKENTALMGRIGKLEGGGGGGGVGGLAGVPGVAGVAGKEGNGTTDEKGQRSRSSSLLGRKRERNPLERSTTGLASQLSAKSAKSAKSE